MLIAGFPGEPSVENPPANAGDLGLILDQEDSQVSKWQPTAVFCLGDSWDR